MTQKPNMETLKLGAGDFKKRKNSYLSDYIGETDVTDFGGHIEIEGEIGWLFFSSIKISGGLGIKAGSGIEAGWGIEAGEGIKAGSGIKAGLGIEAGEGIEAGSGIKAGEGIEAGWGIKAGEGIEAGWGIKAGLSITCKMAIKCSYRIFAGLAVWKKEVNDREKTITCKRIEGGGRVEYGIVKEIN